MGYVKCITSIGMTDHEPMGLRLVMSRGAQDWSSVDNPVDNFLSNFFL